MVRTKKSKKKSIIREIFIWLIYLLILSCGIYVIVHFVGEKTIVKGESMAPCLRDGDNIVVDKVSYRFTNPGRYDLVVFPFKYQEGTCYVKRVIGLPGETVQIEDGVIYINGRELKEEYGNEPIRNPGLASELITLGQDEYFVLGDNRNSSADSREPSIGNISREEIIGRAVFRIWPVSGFGFLV